VPPARFAPELERVEILGGHLAVRDAIKEVVTSTRWKIGPPNLGHQSPNVIRASSSFNRYRSTLSRVSWPPLAPAPPRGASGDNRRWSHRPSAILRREGASRWALAFSGLPSDASDPPCEDRLGEAIGMGKRRGGVCANPSASPFTQCRIDAMEPEAPGGREHVAIV
jgi:hypothetical protein